MFKELNFSKISFLFSSRDLWTYAKLLIIKTLIISEVYSSAFNSHDLVSKLFQNIFSLMQQLSMVFCIMIIGIILIIITFGIESIAKNKINGNSKITIFFIEHFELYCPFILLYLQYTIQKNMNTAFIAYFRFYFVSILWLIRIIFFQKSYSHLEAKINHSLSIFNAFSLLLILNLNIYQKSIVLNLIAGLVVCIANIWYSLRYVEYICPDIEYMELLAKIFITIVMLSRYIETLQFLKDDYKIQLVTIFLLFLILKLEILKNLFQIKYLKMCREFHKTNESTAIIIVYSLFKKTRLFFDFKFYCQLDQIRMALYSQHIDFQKEQFINLGNEENKILLSFIEQKLLLLQCFRLKIFMMFEYLKQQQYLKTFRLANGLTNSQSRFVQYHLELFRLEKQQKIRRQQDLKQIIEANTQQNFCLMKRHSQQLEPQTVMQHEQIILNLIKEVNIVIKLNIKLVKELKMTKVQQDNLLKLIEELAKNKQIINDLVQRYQEKLFYKEFLIGYYVFLNICSTKYTLSQKLMQYFQCIERRTITRQITIQNYLIVIISGQKENVGTITHASVTMKEFLNLDQSTIRSRSSNIRNFMSKSIANHHDHFLLNFIQRGTSNFIGIPRSTPVIVDGKAHLMQLYVKVYNFDDGVRYIGRMKNNFDQQMVIFYDELGEIEAVSQHFLNIINLREPTNIYDLFRNVTKTNFSFQEIERIVQLKNMGKFKLTLYRFPYPQFFLGVCKLKIIQRNADKELRLKKVRKSSQRFLSLYITSKSDTLQFRRFDKLYPQLEDKIKCLSLSDASITKYMLTILFFFVLLAAIVIYNFQKTTQYCTVWQNDLKFYNLTASGFRTRLFEVDSVYLLLEAIQTNLISQEVLIKYNIGLFSQYLTSSIESILSVTMQTESNILQTIPGMNAFNARILTQVDGMNFPSNGSLMSFMQVFSIQKSFYIEQFGANVAPNFTTINPIFEYLKNQFGVQIYNTIFTPLNNFQSSQIATYSLNYQIMLIVSCLMIVSALILLTYQANCIKQRQRKYILMLMKFQQYELEKKLSENKFASHFCEVVIGIFRNLHNFLLKQLNFKIVQIILTALQISRSIGFTETEMDYNKSLIERAIDLFDRTRQSSIHLPFKNRLQDPNSKPSQFIWSCSYYLYRSSNILTNLSNNLNAYNSYNSQISTLRIAVPQLINMAVVKLMFNDTKHYFLTKPLEPTIYTLETTLLTRTIQDKLKALAPWADVSQFLYSTGCDSSDLLCGSLLDGAIKGGFNSALSKFISQVSITYQIIKAGNISSRANAITSLCELNLYYFTYLRPMIYQLHQFLTILTRTAVQTLLKNINLAMAVFLFTGYISALVFFIYDVIKKRIQLRTLKMETLTFCSVDLLTQKITFAYQISLL